MPLTPVFSAGTGIYYGSPDASYRPRPHGWCLDMFPNCRQDKVLHIYQYGLYAELHALQVLTKFILFD